MKTEIKIKGMDCASCALSIEKTLKKLPGVNDANVSYPQEKAYVTHEHHVTKETLEKTVNELGYKAVPEHDEHEHSELLNAKNSVTIAIILAIPLAVLAMGPDFGLIIIRDSFIIQLILTTPIMITGKTFFIRSWKGLIKRSPATMDTLVALGTGTAYIYSIISGLLGGITYFESAGVLLMFILLGEYLEAKSKDNAKKSITGLLKLSPEKATVIRNGKEVTINSSEVIIGDIILVKPGERIPVDGIVLSGITSIDESLVTGESMPVTKKKGSNVIAGSINKEGSITFKALRVGSETYLARIVKIVEQAQSSKAPIQKIADKISSVFVPTVVVIAIISFTIWMILGQSLSFSISSFVTVLIIACPCALGLATPISVIIGSGLGARNGILFKSAEKIEILNKVKNFVFDKTGTLTNGKPEVSDIIPLNGFTKEELLYYAGTAERYSEHPIAQSIIKKAGKIGKPTNFKNHPGLGVSCIIKGKKTLVGNTDFIKIKNKEADELASKGKTIILVSVNRKLAGVIGVSDLIKDGSKEAIKELIKRKLNIYMITGDNPITAKAVASELGITNILAKVKPEEKAIKVSELKKQGLVAFIGDGVNDAPALAVSDVGIALGTGTDVAIETGDVILVKDDLQKVISSIKLSNYTLNKIKQNLFWAFIYNTVGIPIAALGMLTPLIAGIAMSLSSISVVTNSLLLKFKKI